MDSGAEDLGLGAWDFSGPVRSTLKVWAGQVFVVGAVGSSGGGRTEEARPVPMCIHSPGKAQRCLSKGSALLWPNVFA